MPDVKNYHEKVQGISHVHGYIHENQRAIINRLSRAIGHLEKVKRMVEAGEDCSICGASRHFPSTTAKQANLSGWC